MASIVYPLSLGQPRPAAAVPASSNVVRQSTILRNTGHSIVCQASSDESGGVMSRRTAAAVLSVMLSASPVGGVAARSVSDKPVVPSRPSPARALIPDDDDEELIEKAKANRKQRLAEQRETAKEFSKVEGFNSAELVSVQRAINKLARSAAELEAGNLPAVVAVCEDGWKADFEKAAVSLSTTDEAKTSATALLNGIASYEQSAKAGSSDEAKRSFVETVSAFQDWADHAGIAASIKGL